MSPRLECRVGGPGGAARRCRRRRSDARRAVCCARCGVGCQARAHEVPVGAGSELLLGEGGCGRQRGAARAGWLPQAGARCRGGQTTLAAVGDCGRPLRRALAAAVHGRMLWPATDGAGRRWGIGVPAVAVVRAWGASCSIVRPATMRTIATVLIVAADSPKMTMPITAMAAMALHLALRGPATPGRQRHIPEPPHRSPSCAPGSSLIGCLHWPQRPPRPANSPAAG